MITILTALALYFGFVVLVFVVRFIVWIAGELKKESQRVRARQTQQETRTAPQSYHEPEPPTAVILERVTERQSRPTNERTISALKAQRDIIQAQIDDVTETLDLAPRAKDRERLQKRLLQLYGNLAQAEDKIYRAQTR